VLGFVKSNSKEQALVLANFSEKEQSLHREITIHPQVLLNKKVILGNLPADLDDLTLPPYELLITVS
jgi:hypothetical protein